MKRAQLLLAFLCVLPLGAHPMGNFSVSHYARIVPTRDGVSVRYVLDLAEIPTFELLQKWNLEATSPREQLERRAGVQAREWMNNLAISANGRSVAPRLERHALVMTEGAGGMSVMRVTMDLNLPVTGGRLVYEDRNYAERAGWKEIVVAADGQTVIRHATPAAPDRSQALTAYPQDPAVAPPQDLRAAVEWNAPAPTVQPAVTPVNSPTAATPPVPPPASPTPAVSAVQPGAAGPGVVTRGDYLSNLLSNRRIGFAMTLLGLAVAFGLGAMHALSPGHGKTIVAAYLVGSRGTVKQALFLGGMVTFTHTISVFFLGFVTLFLSQYVLPEKIYPVLGVISGLSIVWIGSTMLFQRARRLRATSDHHHAHEHAHSHDHDHQHGDHGHDHHHGPRGHSHMPEGDVTLGSLIALGASGGLVPCPSALVLLLSSIALGRVGLGMVLLTGFSAGLAVVLMGIGMIVLYAKHWLPDQEKAARHPAFRLIPVLSAALIVCIGLVMTGVSLGIIRPDRVLGLT